MNNGNGYLLGMYNQVKGELKRATLGLCPEIPGAKLLDCGCGDGAFTQEAISRIGAAEILGVELSWEHRVAARERGLEVLAHDFNCNTLLGSGYFDVILAAEIIEFLRDADHFIKELHRLLVPGGHLVISTGNIASLHNIAFLLAGRLPLGVRVSKEVYAGTFKALPDDVMHISDEERAGMLFTPRAMRELLEHRGFQVEEIRGVGYYPLPKIMGRAMARIDRNHSAYMVARARKGG
ncbi:hypothetical protein LCGC14_0968680 [marine sediment metagenome]|uniref:Methyltransferase type 11 domain-containing protein n=1 Tax=marine sediment metagenome TaxID=412755 RepID=A0A0F9RIQ6_9ZZZZ